MATRLTPRKSEGKKPTTKRISRIQPRPRRPFRTGRRQLPRQRPRSERLLPRTPRPRKTPRPCTRSHVPNARTRKALRDADAGKNLTSYADEDDLFRKLGIKLGQESSTMPKGRGMRKAPPRGPST